jgi:hypothetical protein
MLNFDKAPTADDPNPIMRAQLVNSEGKPVDNFVSTTLWTPDEGKSVDADSTLEGVNYLGVIYFVSGAKQELVSPVDKAIRHLGDAAGAVTATTTVKRKGVFGIGKKVEVQVEDAGEQQEVIQGQLSKVTPDVMALVPVIILNGGMRFTDLSNAHYVLTDPDNDNKPLVQFSLPIDNPASAVVPYVLRRGEPGGPWLFEKRATLADFVQVDTSSREARRASLIEITKRYVTAS